MRAEFIGLVSDESGRLRVADVFPRRPARNPAPSAPLRVDSEGGAAAGAYVRVRMDGDTAELVEVVAEADTALAGLYGIAAKHHLDPVFPQAVMDEVAGLEANPGIDDPALRDDRALPYVTIDGKTSRDLDQAVYVTREDDGGFFVRYALADASYYVRPGTALFDESLRRGASYYLPGFMVPMLPRALSEGLVSLNPDVERRALVFEMRISPDGRCAETSIVRARIKSHGKLSFGGVQAYYDDPANHGGDMSAAVRENLDALKAAGLLRMKDAERRDVVRYRRTELKLGLESGGVRCLDGYRLSVNIEPRRLVDRYNEQMSLLCNVEGARLLARGGHEHAEHVHPIYRVHPSPDRQKVARFEKLLAALAKTRGLPASSWTWTRDGDVSLNEFLSALPHFDPSSEEGRIARALHRQAVMVNLRSSFSEAPGRHHGVGADVYARFSAPMREVVGVFLHKELWEMIEAERQGASYTSNAEDESLRERIVECANQAKRTQAEITSAAHLAVLDQMFRDAEATGETFRGTVMGMTRTKVHITFDAPPVDVKVYVRDLEEAHGTLELRDEGSAMRGANGAGWRIGDATTVSVRGFDPQRRRWKLDLG